MKYVCDVCGWVYDEAVGDADLGIAPGTKFEDLPEDFLCPFDDQTGELNTTANSVSIHWYGKSANGKMAAFRSRILRPVRRILKRIRRGKE